MSLNCLHAFLGVNKTVISEAICFPFLVFFFFKENLQLWASLSYFLQENKQQQQQLLEVAGRNNTTVEPR